MHRLLPTDPDAFEPRALELFTQQYETVPAYRAWCDHALRQQDRTVADVQHWHDVPALPIAAFKQLDVWAPGAPTVASWQSSGTTAADRSTHRLGGLEHYDAAIDAGVRAALLPDVATGEREPLVCVQLQPCADDAPSSSLSHMYDRIRSGPLCSDGGAFVDAEYAVDVAGAWAALERAAANDQPVVVLATSFALAMLLDGAEDAGLPALELPHASRVVDTGGFKGRTRELSRAELLAHVERALGVPAAWCENEYGMSELSSQAWLGTVAEAAGHPLDHAPSTRWVPPFMRVRVVDPVTLDAVADGESGLLVFHDLANVWSCAVVRSEDVGIRRGTSFELLGRAPDAALKGCSLRLEDVHAAR